VQGAGRQAPPNSFTRPRFVAAITRAVTGRLRLSPTHLTCRSCSARRLHCHPRAAARQLGPTMEEVAEALRVAIAVNGGAAPVLRAGVMDALTARDDKVEPRPVTA
jgi:alkylhydroperoxidase/carboxymuconolactone decarboxylase family protein YurZ